VKELQVECVDMYGKVYGHHAWVEPHYDPDDSSVHKHF
jgi:hypothetical protein